MDLLELLDKCDQSILNDASTALTKFRLKHYDGDIEKFHARLALLFDYIVKGVKEKNVMPVVCYVEQIAEQRFKSGFDLQEVQMAFNVLEEHIWKYVLEYISAGSQAEALRLISSIIGAGKDALARTYFHLATISKN
jgi:hypothetical protein